MCAEAPAGVEDAVPRDAELVCEAARFAFRFLAGQGFSTDAYVAISVRDDAVQDPQSHGARAFGSFDRNRLHARVGSYRSCCEMSKEGGPFGREMDEAMYRSFLVHEIAHAIANVNFTVARPTRAAHEYIAYVTQFASLETAVRDEIVARSGLTGFDRADQIKDVYYLMSPESFAINAWLHYSRAESGASFLREVLDGALALSRY